MLSLIFDTETTGIYLFNYPVDHPDQPDVVQLCAMLADEERVYTAVNMFIHTETPIPEEAYAVHRINREMTARVGVSRSTACRTLDNMARKADVLVGHNIDFDIKIMMAATLREGGAGEALKKTSYCTMRNSTDVCKIPNPRFPTKFKWPKLTEAYEMLVDPRGFDGAHDAMADARATHALYRVLTK